MIGKRKRLRDRKKEAKEGTEVVLVRWGLCWRKERRVKKGGEKE